jgi:transposase-like protein
MAAAQRFFFRAIRQHGAPRVITLDGYAPSHREVAKLKAAGTLPGRVQVRSSKYLNSLIEQDHRRINSASGRCWGSSDSQTAAVTIRGIEWRRKLKNNNSTSNL